MSTDYSGNVCVSTNTSNDAAVQYRHYTCLGDIPMSSAEWDRIVELADVGGIFLSHLWIHQWWTHFGEDKELFFVTAELDGKVIGFVALMIDCDKNLRFIADKKSDYLGFALPPDQQHLFTGFIAYLNDCRDRWKIAHLRNIPRDSAQRQFLESSCLDIGLSVWNNYSVAAPYLKVTGNGDAVESILNQSRFRRSERQVHSQGDVTFEVIKTRERAAAFWESFARQNIERCSQRGDKSAFSDPNYLPFLKSIFENDPQQKWVHFSVVLLDDRPIAFHFGFISQNRLIWYKPSFDLGIRKGSPGIVLIHGLIDYALENSILEFDFTIGEEPFKDRFCRDRRIVDEFRIYQSRAHYLIELNYWRARRLLKRIAE